MTYLRQFSAFLTLKSPGGKEEVVPSINDFITKLEEEGKGPSVLEACISALTHVPSAYAKWIRIVPKFPSRTSDMSNLLKKRKMESRQKGRGGQVDFANKLPNMLTLIDRRNITFKLDARHNMGFVLCVPRLTRGDTL